MWHFRTKIAGSQSRLWRIMELNPAASGDAQWKRSHSAKQGVFWKNAGSAKVRVTLPCGNERDVFQVNAIVADYTLQKQDGREWKSEDRINNPRSFPGLGLNP
jgi:hypothetical protein